jgi:hypothetical protein
MVLGDHAADVFSVEEILLEFGFRDEIGGFAIELREHTDHAGVGFLGRFSFPVKLQHREHALIPIVHKSSPSKKDKKSFTKNDGDGIGSKVGSNQLPRSGLLEQSDWNECADHGG